nr:hypothetical protein [Tanacetum cinerariifolium]
MISLADKVILSGADNRPPMLVKDMYDSWKSRMELYMLSRQHGRMILKSVKHGSLLWPTIEEDGVTRLKKYSELSAAEAIQADNPTTATQKVFETYKNVTQEIRDQLNAEAEAVQIILIGIDNDIYSTVDACPNACEMWKAIERLKQGSFGRASSSAGVKHLIPSRLTRY